MKKVILLLSALPFLAACPSQDEIRDMMESLTAKRNEAVKVLSTQDYSLEGLLKAQDYFFEFSERLHLMKVDDESKKNIQSLIQSFGVKKFCESFVVPTSYWKPLAQYCATGTFYKCSPEIKEYGNTLKLMKDLAGSENKMALDGEPTCN